MKIIYFLEKIASSFIIYICCTYSDCYRLIKPFAVSYKSKISLKTNSNDQTILLIQDKDAFTDMFIIFKSFGISENKSNYIINTLQDLGIFIMIIFIIINILI